VGFIDSLAVSLFAEEPSHLLRRSLAYTAATPLPALASASSAIRRAVSHPASAYGSSGGVAPQHVGTGGGGGGQDAVIGHLVPAGAPGSRRS
jgi:hypothetical protein